MFLNKLPISSKVKVLFRTEAGTIPEIGTGHIYRSLAIAKILKKKYNLRNNEINFITKNQNKYKITKKIIKKSNFVHKIYSDKLLDENKKSEIEILKKNASKILIIDRWVKTNKKTLSLLKKYFSKIILIDSRSKKNNLCDLTLNALVNKKNKNEFDNLILPSYNSKKFIDKKKIISKEIKNVFISFGGFDCNFFTKKIINILSRFDLNLNIFISEKYKKLRTSKNLNIYFFNEKNYYKCLGRSDVSLVSGGLTQFDSLLFNIPIICLPQYRHQLINSVIINKKKANILINTSKLKLENSFTKNFNLMYKNAGLRKSLVKNGKKIVNISNMDKALKKIFKVCDNEID